MRIQTLTLLWLIAQLLSHPVYAEKYSLSGPYLGQTRPGMLPEVFAPGAISTEGWEVNGVFSPDMNEFYYLRGVITDGKFLQQFVVLKQDGGWWKEHVISPRVGQPFVSPDGKTMHLGNRYMSRTADGWSDIKSMGEQFEQYRIMRMTASETGMVVFDEAKHEGDSQIRYSRFIDGKYEEPKAFGKNINTGMYNVHPFIAPDESYIIWDGQRESEFRNADLFISFKTSEGGWGEAIKFGDEINTESNETGARVTPDGNYLFFNRNMGTFEMTNEEGEVRTLPNMDIFWVDAKVIENLRPKN